LLLGALTYADRRLHGYDAAVLAEVVEHVDPGRLGALEQAVFGAAAPPAVLVTTPNAEYNPRYPGLAPGAFRHPDHRFEWTPPPSPGTGSPGGGGRGRSAAPGRGGWLTARGTRRGSSRSATMMPRWARRRKWWC